MAKKILLVIDVQNDFVDGSLGTKEAQAMLPTLLEKVRSFDGDVIYTKDTHPENYLETQEGKNLPVPHCIKGTKNSSRRAARRSMKSRHSAALCLRMNSISAIRLARLRASSSSVSARTSASSRTRSCSKPPCPNSPSPSTPPAAPASRRKSMPQRSKS